MVLTKNESFPSYGSLIWDIPDMAKSLLNRVRNFALSLFASPVAKAEPVAGETAAERAGILIDKYGNNILRMAYSYLHNMSDAEDILQDTLIQFIKTDPSFESAEHEKAWLLRVAANLSKNKIQYNKLRETDELAEELTSEEKDDLAFVWDAVKELPENFREVVHLFYQEGYATKEIAEILGKNESTVRSDLKRGREKLKVVLKEAYDFE
jgi:RNA polymerase sigma-70 factor (ECF subfamily)